MNLRQQIGAELQRVREKQKLTRKQVANMAKVNERFIRQWECGELNITADSVDKVAAVLKREIKFRL